VASSAAASTPAMGASPGGIDVGQQQLVGAGQRGRELVQQVAGAREAVGLERDHHATARRGGPPRWWLQAPVGWWP
jgi:hypothetical protein